MQKSSKKESKKKCGWGEDTKTNKKKSKINFVFSQKERWEIKLELLYESIIKIDMVHNIFTISFSFFTGTLTHGASQIFLKYKQLFKYH